MHKIQSFEKESLLISLIVPVYNTPAGFLKECIDSIINQTYHNLEIIIVDDGSEQSTRNDCNMLAEKIIQAGMLCSVIHKENGGISSARNVGLDSCHGDYICYIDSDDLLEKHYCETLLHAIVSYNVPVASCGHQLFSENLQVKELSGVPDAVLYSGTELWKNVNMGYVWNKMFDLQKFRNCKFDTKYTMAEDAAFNIVWYKIAQECAGTKAALYYHRINPKSVSSNLTAQQYKQAIEVWNMLLEIPERQQSAELVRKTTIEQCGWLLRYCMALVHEKPDGWKQTVQQEKEKFCSFISPYSSYCNNKLIKISYPLMKMPLPFSVLYLGFLYGCFDIRRTIRTTRTQE